MKKQIKVESIYFLFFVVGLLLIAYFWRDMQFNQDAYYQRR